MILRVVTAAPVFLLLYLIGYLNQKEKSKTLRFENHVTQKLLGIIS